MKKTVLSIAAAALVSSALFTGCGSDSANPVAVVTTATIGTGPALSIGQTITQSAKGYQTVSGGLLDLDGDVTTTNDLFVFGNLVMQAPANYSVVTPITDLIVTQIEAGLTQANAEAAVATALGLKTTDLMYTSETAKAAGLDATTQAKLLATNATLLASFANTTTRSVRAESIPNPFATTTTTTSSASSVASSVASTVASSSAEAIPNPFAPASSSSTPAASSSAPAASSSAPAASSSAPAASSSAPAASSSSATFDANAVAATILAKLSATFTATVAATQASIATSLAAGKSLQAIAVEQVTSIFATVANVVNSTQLTGAAATAYAAAIAGHSSSMATSSSDYAMSSSAPAASSSAPAASSSAPAASSSAPAASSSAEAIPNPFATSSTATTTSSSVASSTSTAASSSAEAIPNPFG